MIFLKPYISLKEYLERFTLFALGRLHIRIHQIKSQDQTPFAHTHPFHYCSIILSGGYVEWIDDKETLHKAGSVLFRRNTTYHRIQSILQGTRTLFIAWGTPKYQWTFSKAPVASCEVLDGIQPGIYMRTLSGVDKYSKFDVYWHLSSDTVDGAMTKKQPSINQQTKGTFICELF